MYQPNFPVCSRCIQELIEYVRLQVFIFYLPAPKVSLLC